MSQPPPPTTPVWIERMGHAIGCRLCHRWQIVANDADKAARFIEQHRQCCGPKTGSQ